MDKQKFRDALLGGLTSNPVFVLVIGMCPVIAQSNTVENAFALGCATGVVLILGNLIISSLRNVIPNGVRIPAYITIIATVTTVLILFVKSYMYEMYDSIGPFLSLVAVNCIVMGRAEAFSSKNNPIATFIDSTSISLGFLGGITVLGLARESLTKLGFSVFSTVAGGFIVLGFLIVLYNLIFSATKNYIEKRKNRRMNLTQSVNTQI